MTPNTLGQRVTLRREDTAYVVTVPLLDRPETPLDAEWRGGWLFVGTPDQYERRIRLTEGTGEQVAADEISVEVGAEELEVVVPVTRVGVEA